MFSSCNIVVDDSDDGGEETLTPIEENVPTEEDIALPDMDMDMSPSSVSDCTSLCRTAAGSYEITEECATCLIANYKASGHMFPTSRSNAGHRGLTGFKVDQNELVSIYDDAGTSTETGVMFHFGIMGDNDMTPDAVWEVKMSDGTSRYYDVNHPCPTQCLTSGLTGRAASSDCSSICGRSGSSYEISKDCADCLKANYIQNGNKFPPYTKSPATKAGLNGFHIDMDEVRDILDEARANGDSEVMFHFGVMGDNVNTPKGIWEVKERDGSYTYYDFVNPCPDFCL